MIETLELLKTPLVQDALKASLMAAVMCAYMGVFVVLRRIVFIGAALAEVASFGQALALTPFVIALLEKSCELIPLLHILDHVRPLFVAVVMMLAAVGLLSQHKVGRRIPREAVIGAVFAGASGLTLLTLSKLPTHGQESLDVLAGNILGVETLEMMELMVCGGIIALLQLLFYKEFVLVAFDPEVARSLGYRAGAWDLVWYISLGMMIAVSIHVVGTILVFAYLVLPPVTALLLSRRLGIVLWLSVFFAVISTVVGTLIAVSPLDVPISYAIVASCAVLYALTWSATGLVGLARRTQ